MSVSLVIESGPKRTRPVTVYEMDLGSTSVTPEQLNGQIRSFDSRQNPPIRLRVEPGFITVFGSQIGVVLPRIDLNFYRLALTGSGEMELFYTITLSSAVISRYARAVLPIHERSRYVERSLDDIEITYQSKSWTTWADAPHSDDWGNA